MRVYHTARKDEAQIMKPLELSVPHVKKVHSRSLHDYLIHSANGLYDLFIAVNPTRYEVLMVDRFSEAGGKAELNAGQILLKPEKSGNETMDIRFHKFPVYDATEEEYDPSDDNDPLNVLYDYLTKISCVRTAQRGKKSTEMHRDENGFLRLVKTPAGESEETRRKRHGITPSYARWIRTNIVSRFRGHGNPDAQLYIIDELPDGTEFPESIATLYQLRLKRPYIHWIPLDDVNSCYVSLSQVKSVEMFADIYRYMEKLGASDIVMRRVLSLIDRLAVRSYHGPDVGIRRIYTDEDL